MKVRCTYHDLVQDKYNGSWYEPNKEYEVTAERGEELIASGYFVAVEVTEEKPKRKSKKSAE